MLTLGLHCKRQRWLADTLFPLPRGSGAGPRVEGKTVRAHLITIDDSNTRQIISSAPLLMFKLNALVNVFAITHRVSLSLILPFWGNKCLYFCSVLDEQWLSIELAVLRKVQRGSFYHVESLPGYPYSRNRTAEFFKYFEFNCHFDSYSNELAADWSECC